MNRRADSQKAAHHDFTVGASPPVRKHGGSEAGEGFVHSLAWLRFAVDQYPAIPYTQNAPAAFGQGEPADHQVSTARRRRNGGADLLHQLVPHFFFDQGDLPATSLVRIADDSLTSD